MKGFARILSVFMCMLMVLYVIPAEVYSLKIGASELTSEKIEDTNNVLSTASTEVTALGEDVSKRTASSKTIRMSDGSYRLVQYANEVHYQDEGEWVEYDNSLSLSSNSVILGESSNKDASVFVTTSNPTGLKFGQSTSGNVVSFAEGSNKLEMSIIGANKNVGVVQASRSAELKSADKYEEIITIENYSSSVLYSNVFDNAHIRYTAAGNTVKEDIIVHKKADSYEYSFNFSLTGLNAEQLSDGSIVFTDEDTDAIMYYIPVGYMYDNVGDTSTAVSYNLTQTATGCIVTVTADAEWINDNERDFPVVIDPTLEKSNEYLYYRIKDADVYTNQTSTSMWQAELMHVGVYNGKRYDSLIGVAQQGESESFTVDLFKIPEGSVVTKAQLELYAHEYSGTTTVTLHAVTSDWNHQALTYATRPSYRSIVVDYKKVTAAGTDYTFDFTSVAHEWFEQSNADSNCSRGLLLTTDDNNYVAFATVNYQNAEKCPSITISYRDTKGLDSRWSYNTQSAGAAGAGAVNLFTGNLVFVHDDITTNGEILPLTVSHVYNSHYTSQQYTNVDGDIHTADYTNMKVGKGFKLSVQESVTEKEIDDSIWYIYNDSDGTELYFYNFNGDSEYISEDGYDLSITKSNGIYTMSDSVGNTKKFNSEGKLYEIKDPFGNTRTYNYANGRVISISYKPNGGSNATQLTFIYNSNNALQKIINEQDTSQYVTFSYSATYNGTASSSYSGFLRTITHSKGVGNCSFTYTAAGRLQRVTDTATGNKLFYQYNTSKNYSASYAMIDSVTEETSSATGQKVSFVYGSETTAVRTSGNDDNHGNADDLLTHYVFDDHGRTVSAYSTNLSGTEVYGASNAEYSPTVQGSKKNHTITKDSVSGVPAVNLIKNSSMESTDSWSGYYSGTGYSSTRSTDQKYIGSYSYKLTSTTNKSSGFTERRQNVTLTEGGTYTLSAYVRVQSLDATTGFYLELGGNSSRKIKDNSPVYAQNGWQRISVTAELAAGTHQVRLILQKSIGTVYVDCVQLEKSDGASKYNLLNNGGFIGDLTGWYPTTDIYSGGKAKLKGVPETQVRIYQTVNTNLPITTTFVLSGWAEADSVARRDGKNNFELVAKLNYSDGSSELTNVPFSTDNAELQFASGAVVSKKTDTSLSINNITVYVYYSNNANEAFFDNICLAIEPAQTYLYDDDGNLMSATNAEGNKINAAYSEDGVDILSYTNIVGELYNYTYSSDIPHLLTSVLKLYNGDKFLKTDYEYDSYGNLTKQTDRDMNSGAVTDNITTQSSYDSYGRLLSVTDTLDNTTTYNRNTATELLNYVQDANGHRTGYEYNEVSELLEAVFNDKDKDGTIDTGEEKVEYTYNSKNQLAKIITDSTTYNLSYDSFGNLSTVKAGTNTLASYEYNDNNGKLTKTTYGNNFTVTNVYDNLDRLSQIMYNNAVAYTVSYNGDGAVSKIVDAKSGITTEYEYDSLGRLVTATERETSTNTAVLGTSNFFDSYGRPLFSTYTLPSQHLYYTVGYLPNSSLINRYTAADSTNSLTRTYTYDGLQRVTSVSTQFNDLGTLQESYTYVSDANSTSGLVASYTVGGNTYSYTYDRVGNITQIDENGDVRRLYTYDTIGQLIREYVYPATGSVQQYQYSYDKSGNITQSIYSVGSSNTTYNYTYGNQNWGDLLTNYNGTAITYDTIGNPLKWRNANQLSWQGRNLIALQHTDGSYSAYAYNADGIRTQKGYVNAEGTVGEITAKYTLDGNKIVAEQRGDITLYYLYDDTGSIMGISYGYDTYTFAKNIQGDVIGIYSGGALVAKYEYNAYGQILSITNASGTDISGNASHIANINPFRYRGYYYDTETGFYYLQSRYYDPVVGRFLNADAFVSTGQGILGNNMFAYCGNNPVARIDTNGLFWDIGLDLVSLGHSIYEVWEDPTDPWAWFGFAGDVVDLLPIVTGVGESVKIARTANKVVDAVDTAHDTSKVIDAVDTAHDAIKAIDVATDGFGTLSRAREYGIKSYNVLKKQLKGTGLEAHHIIEQRLAKSLHLDPNKMLSVAVTVEEHRAFTKAWRDAIKYGTNYDQVSVTQVYLHATEIYREYPELLEAVRKTLLN